VAHIGFRKMIGMFLRKSPVGRIRRVAGQAERAGVNVAIDQLEVHSLAGGSIENVVAGLIHARETDVEAKWIELCAIDLAGRDPVAVIEAASRVRDGWIETVRPDESKPIVANCRDGSGMKARAWVEYRLALAMVMFNDIEAYPNHVGLVNRMLSRIADADSPDQLIRSTAADEQRLLEQERKSVPGLRRLTLEYQPTT